MVCATAADPLEGAEGAAAADPLEGEEGAARHFAPAQAARVAAPLDDTALGQLQLGH